MVLMAEREGMDGGGGGGCGEVCDGVFRLSSADLEACGIERMAGRMELGWIGRVGID